ncbi:terminase small subunit [Carnimonas bestiolae]|uniref:terminase small subunit n=1 Tax=Carnimonas bestiolae TaxID=3402172 RepID=UPI003EDBB5D7
MATTTKKGRPTKVAVPLRTAKAKKYLAGDYEKAGHAVPSVAGLSRYMGVDRSTIYAWGEEDRDFSYILEAILAEQEQLLISKGLRNEYNASLVKLMLGKHGYSEKAEVDNTSSDGSMTPKPSVIQLVAPDDNGED